MQEIADLKTGPYSTYREAGEAFLEGLALLLRNERYRIVSRTHESPIHDTAVFVRRDDHGHSLVRLRHRDNEFTKQIIRFSPEEWIAVKKILAEEYTPQWVHAKHRQQRRVKQAARVRHASQQLHSG